MSSLCPSCFCLCSQCKYFLGLARNDYRFRDVAPSTGAGEGACSSSPSFALQAFSFLCSWSLLGTLRSDDADENDNVKKTIGFISKTTTLHVHYTCL